MLQSAEIQQMLVEEIEFIANMCRAYKPKQAPEIHGEKSLDEYLNIAAGQATELEVN